MSDTGGNETRSNNQSDLSDLDQRVEDAKRKHSGADEEIGPDNSMLGMAWRISTELVVAVFIGCALGYGIDYIAKTGPIFIILGLILGTIAGIRNTFKLVLKMEAAEKERLEKHSKR